MGGLLTLPENIRLDGNRLSSLLHIRINYYIKQFYRKVFQLKIMTNFLIFGPSSTSYKLITHGNLKHNFLAITHQNFEKMNNL